VTVIADDDIMNHRSMAARTMLLNGIDRPTIVKMTGLSKETLAQIRH